MALHNILQSIISALMTNQRTADDSIYVKSEAIDNQNSVFKFWRKLKKSTCTTNLYKLVTNMFYKRFL